MATFPSPSPVDNEDLSPIEIPVEEFADILSEEEVMKIDHEVSQEVDHFENLVDKIEDAHELLKLGQDVIDRFTRDKSTREPLEQTLRLGFEMLNPATMRGMNLPFDGACDIVHPLIRENGVKYQSKFCKSLLPPQGPFNIDIHDVGIPKIEQRAARYTKELNRIAKRMGYSIEQAKLYLYMTYAGTGFKKVYFDYNRGIPASDFVKIEDFVTSDLTRDLESAECYTHVILRSENELKKDISASRYVDIQDTLVLQQPDQDVLGSVTADAFDEPEIAPETQVYTLLEQYVDLDLRGIDEAAEGTDYALPYQITVDHNSGKVLSIRRNWKENDPYKQKIVNFFEYTLVPSTGYYGLGLFHLLGDFQKTLTAITRSLVDAASFANMQAGFKKKGLRWNGPKDPLKPGEFRDIELLDNTKLSDVLMPLVFKEPSQTLFELQRALTADGQKFADNLEQIVNNAGANYGKVGTTMALLEESSQFFASVFQRVYEQQQKELNYIAELCQEKLGPEFVADFNGDGILDLTPASDPNYPTRAHRLALAQQKLQLAMQAPQVHDLRAAFQTFYEALGEPDEVIARVLPQPQQAQPQDPMSDIIAASSGQPIKAFEGQDHDAHIAVKGAFVADPTHQNELMAPTLQALQANIKEHLVLKYVEAMKGTLGPQQAASEVAQAQAAQEVLQANQLAAQLAANGGLQNPELIYANAEMQKAQTDKLSKEFDIRIKSIDKILDAAKLDLDKQKEQNRAIEKTAELQLKGKQLQVDAETELLGMAQDNLHKYLDHDIKQKQTSQKSQKPSPNGKKQ